MAHGSAAHVRRVRAAAGSIAKAQGPLIEPFEMCILTWERCLSDHERIAFIRTPRHCTMSGRGCWTHK